MSFEETLASIDASLKSLLTIAMTGASASVELGKPETAVTKATRTKKTDAAVIPTDTAATRYWLIEAHNTVYEQAPGAPDCTFTGAVLVTEAVYTERKAEFAKKSVTAVQTATTASASTAAATAQTASSSAAVVSFKQVVDALTSLSKDTRPGKGRDAIVAFVGKHGVAKVPGLEALGKNAELLAEVEALLAPDAVVDDVFA